MNAVDKPIAAPQPAEMHARTITCALVPLMACMGCAPSREPDVYEMLFGRTRYLPGHSIVAKDYIEDYWDIPKAVKHCKAKFITFDLTLTDGATSAYFSPKTQDSLKCVMRKYPQGTFHIVPADIARKLIPADDSIYRI